MKKFWSVCIVLLLLGFSVSVSALDIPQRASVGGKYSDLKQILKCQKDSKQYGRFKEYGYWGGGSWCGKHGQAGYWVWVAPNWYIWAKKGRKPEIPAQASVYGKYSGIKQILNCKPDRSKYGNFKDYGYWEGGSWCGKRGKAGYWVYHFPNWYIWRKKH